jgi:hypothetical protein
MNITDEHGNRACLMNTSENSLYSGLARASSSGDIVVPEKGHLLEALHTCWMPNKAFVTAD